jgi:hypothetical protein
MERFTSAIRISLSSQNWYAALFLALAMPDICTKLETPSSGTSGPRYKEWFDRYLRAIYTKDIMGRQTVFMTAGDCWALRCSLLHEGSDDIGEQRARETLSRFRFTTVGSHRIRIEKVLVLNVSRFCEEFCQAVESWSNDVASNKSVRDRIASMIEIQLGPFSPHPGIQIG